MTNESPSSITPPNAVIQKRTFGGHSYSIAYSTTTLPTIAGNASSATFNPLTRTLFTTDNGVPSIHEFQMDGTFRRTIALSGFTDVESICWLEGTRFIIGEEGNPGVVNSICEVDIAQTGAVTITKGGANWIRTIATGITSGANLAIEGIAYDPRRQLFYCVTENGNGGVWNVWQVPRTGGSTTQLFSLVTPLTGVATDVSDLFYDRTEDVLWLISDNEVKIMKFSMQGQLLEQTPISAVFTQAEGLCFTPDMNTMFVLGEARMYQRLPRNLAIK